MMLNVASCQISLRTMNVALMNVESCNLGCYEFRPIGLGSNTRQTACCGTTAAPGVQLAAFWAHCSPMGLDCREGASGVTQPFTWSQGARMW